MNTVNPAVQFHPSADQPGRNLRQWWRVIAALIAAAFFMEAVFAGAMLSGVGWARKAHAASAAILIVSTFAAGLVCAVTLRRVPYGLRFGLTLLSLAAVALVQAVLGALSGKGANLIWIHLPLGVALVALAGQTVVGARRLGGD